MRKVVGIYKITSPSGKVYIGQSNNIFYRWRYHYKKLHCKRQIRLYNSLVKYGYEKHKFEVLCTCEVEELDDLEKRCIIEFNSTDKNKGLNCREGGNGKIVSEDAKEKMRQNALGNTNMLGKKHSKETRKLISKNRKGIRPSKETRLKMSVARKGFNHTEEAKKKMSLCNKFTRRIKNTTTNIIHTL